MGDKKITTPPKYIPSPTSPLYSCCCSSVKFCPNVNKFKKYIITKLKATFAKKYRSTGIFFGLNIFVISCIKYIFFPLYFFDLFHYTIILYFSFIFLYVIKKTRLDLSALSNSGKTEKRFDFVIFTEKSVYACECNFYASSGSKLNETARSYKALALASKNIKGFKFVWFTDGLGWLSAKNNLKETFDVLDDIYCIKELEENILKTF
ncbi:MAG TPA: hypothetical protein GX709_05320 [Clostridiales bacterium]|nr:hypothetical protein [Clostridiales bacterium]